MPLLESCTSISKSFGSRALFEDISLGISEGERLGLIGPNGSGKSKGYAAAERAAMFHDTAARAYRIDV